LLLNNWDLAASNNRIYEVGKELRYVVQDLGGSLGKTRWPIGSRNDIEDFESQDFVRGVERGRVLFDYHARHKHLLRGIAPDDVVWVCRLMARLSDRQLADAFRGAGYADDVAARYVRKLRAKIAQGLALEKHPRADAEPAGGIGARSERRRDRLRAVADRNDGSRRAERYRDGRGAADDEVRAREGLLADALDDDRHLDTDDLRVAVGVVNGHDDGRAADGGGGDLDLGRVCRHGSEGEDECGEDNERSLDHGTGLQAPK
jgi:hypothetical protein